MNYFYTIQLINFQLFKNQMLTNSICNILLFLNMDKNSIIELLKNEKLVSESIVYKKGEWIEKQGNNTHFIYYIEEGSVKIYIQNNDSEQIIRFGYSSDIIVALDSFLTNNPTDFNIQTLKKTTVKRILKSDFKAFVNSNESTLKIWISILENLVIQQIEREKDLLIDSPLERYSRVLKRSPRLFQEIPNKHIANYLRMTPETLSRLKKS